MRDDRRGDRQKPPCPSKIAPTKSEAGLSLLSDDLRLKSSVTIKVSCGYEPSAIGYSFLSNVKGYPQILIFNGKKTGCRLPKS